MFKFLIEYWPQLTIIFIWLANLFIALAHHGDDKNEKYNFWITLISFMLMMTLLYFGGFFD